MTDPDVKPHDVKPQDVEPETVPLDHAKEPELPPPKADDEAEGKAENESEAEDFEYPVPDIPDFPQLTADQIEPPAGHNNKGHPAYSPQQLITYVQTNWEVAALDTQAAHAKRIAEYHRRDVHFCDALGWLHYRWKNWVADDRRATQTAALAASLSKKVREEAGQLFEYSKLLTLAGRSSDAEAMAQAATTHLRHARQVEDYRFIEGALNFAAGLHELRIDVKVFDQKPWLLPFCNRVWERGELREHRRQDYVLTVSPVQIDPNIDQTEWLALLDSMTGGNAELARSLQDTAGYVVSAASHLRKIPWLYGPAGTGKSTFAELLSTLLGPMAISVDPTKLSGKQVARERLGADLWNRRLVVCAEAGNKLLDAEVLKTLSGADSFPVRLLYKEAFTAQPNHVLVMVSNDSPRLEAYDPALKGRIMALPFTHPLRDNPLKLTGAARLEEVRKDPNSPLVRGFAAWVLEGLERVYLTQTIFQAPEVQAASEQFWADTDPLTSFWESFSIAQLEAGIFKRDLRARYEYWCQSEGARPFAPTPWAKACRSIGLYEVRRSKENTRTWVLDMGALRQARRSTEITFTKTMGEGATNTADLPPLPTEGSILDNLGEEEKKTMNIYGSAVTDGRYGIYLPNGHAVDNANLDLKEVLEA